MQNKLLRLDCKSTECQIFSFVKSIWGISVKIFVFITICLYLGCSSQPTKPVKEALVEISVVAGSEQDFMMVRHVKISGTNYQIGKEIAKLAQSDGIELTPSGDPLKNNVQLSYFKTIFQPLYERIRGVADVYGMPLDDYRYALSYLPQFQGAYGCSAVYYPPEMTARGHGILSRNFDYGTGDFLFREDGEKVTSRPIVFEFYPDEGYPSIAICAYDLLGAVIDGINIYGLTVSILADGIQTFPVQEETINVREVGFHELASMRYVLETCKTVEEAKEVLLSIRHYVNYASCHFIIADSSGKSFIFEFSPNRNQAYITDGTGPQCITNHLIFPDAPQKPDKNSLSRLNTLEQSIIQINKLNLDAIKEINGRVANIYVGSIIRTLWHAIYDTTQPSLSVKFYLGDQINPDATINYLYSNYITFVFSSDKK